MGYGSNFLQVSNILINMILTKANLLKFLSASFLFILVSFSLLPFSTHAHAGSHDNFISNEENMMMDDINSEDGYMMNSWSDIHSQRMMSYHSGGYMVLWWIFGILALNLLILGNIALWKKVKQN